MFAVYVSFLVTIIATTSQAIFKGVYSDPNHPQCARFILFETDSSASMYGFDAAGGEGVPCDHLNDVKWGPLPAVITDSTIEVDFSSKGGPSDLTGKFNSELNEIDWEDGNAWNRVFPQSMMKNEYRISTYSVFDGEYSDPNHPSCGRFVVANTNATAAIYGVDAAGGEGAMCDGINDIPWTVPAVLPSSTSILADFSSKGGPSDLSGAYNFDKAEIDWEDGNAWTKVKMCAGMIKKEPL